MQNRRLRSRPRNSATAQQRGRELNRRFVGFAGADAHHLLDRGDENLAVADLARARGLDDGFDRLLEDSIGHNDLDFHFGQEIHHIFRAAIKLGMPFLPAETFDLGHGQSAHPDFRQGFTHFIELERLYHSVYFFHGGLSRVAVVGSIATKGGGRGDLPAELLSILRRNRIAPILAKTALGDAYAYRRLAALVLVSLDQPHPPLDVFFALAPRPVLGRA